MAVREEKEGACWNTGVTVEQNLAVIIEGWRGGELREGGGEREHCAGLGGDIFKDESKRRCLVEKIGRE